MGTTRDDGSQQAMWVATADLPQGGGHPFYERLNQILNAAGFDAFVEQLCAPFYARMGRPSLVPGRYFRLLLVGYVEGLDSERAELARFDRSRTKKTSNAEWTHPHDPDARVTKMKDGRTHLAHKAEHTVDLETGAVVGVTVQGADTGDTASMVETLIAAAEQMESVLPDGPGIEDVVGDKGYHSNETLAAGAPQLHL